MSAHQAIHTTIHHLDYILTFIITGLSLTLLDGILTTIVLLLTIAYWSQKNVNIFRHNKSKDKGEIFEED